MNGIVIDINPVLVRLGPIEVRWYSIAILAAVLVAVAIALRETRKRGIRSEDVYTMAVWSVLAGLVGARLFHVIDRLQYYIANPVQIVQFQNGGLAIWGGLGCGAVTAGVIAWRKHINLGRLFDAAVPALLVAQIIGRFGCIVNGDAYGGPTTLPWAFIYVNPGAAIPNSLVGVPTHPYPVYEQLWNLASLLLLLRVRRYFKADGQAFLAYIALYSAARLMLTFVREETQVIWGLQQAQVLAIAGIVVASGAFAYLQFVRKPHTAASSESATSSGGQG